MRFNGWSTSSSIPSSTRNTVRLNLKNVRPIWSRIRDSQHSGRRSSVKNVYISRTRLQNIVNSVEPLIDETTWAGGEMWWERVAAKAARTWKSQTFCVQYLVNTVGCFLVLPDSADPAYRTGQLVCECISGRNLTLLFATCTATGDSIWKNLNVQFFQLMLSSPTVYQNPVNLTNFCQFCDFSKGSFGPLI